MASYIKYYNLQILDVKNYSLAQLKLYVNVIQIPIILKKKYYTEICFPDKSPRTIKLRVQNNTFLSSLGGQRINGEIYFRLSKPEKLREYF